MNPKAKFYLIGGAVRDKYLGAESKDFDYVVVCKSFEEMRGEILSRNGKIFLETPEYLTIRAIIPNFGAADFVCSRRDGNYSDNRRPDSVEIGSLYQDQKRRDFRCNSIAIDADTGEVIDPFNGIEDCKNKVLNCVGEASERFTEDSLRLIRAMRFSITKGLTLSDKIKNCLFDSVLLDLLDNIGKERIWTELTKCFEHDTFETLKFLDEYHRLRKSIFANKRFGIWLKPSLKKL